MMFEDSRLYCVVDHLGHTISAHRTREAAGWKILAYHDANDYHIEESSVLGFFYTTPKRQRRAGTFAEA